MSNRNLNPNEIDVYGRTAVSLAAQYGDDEIMEVLLAYEEVDAEARDDDHAVASVVCGRIRQS
ncbi:hypothetical protein BO71DRAFT_403653 [Aspergillus ellipticus CBS 707.79]|uniref:Uncharacterized protein n=1 Tax=Aspergillus ellipticus CBS 707.79 TaxID=1448320 RepID=A0A319EC59_9EURO|nr:hypothetical protein BO71DRAFT_403653 [Aspergillus ellipticus CBS 707.79]